jgi:hypothetical protein
MRAPGLSFPPLLLLLLLSAAFATAKQSKVPLRPKLRQVVVAKGQLTASQHQPPQEFDGLPGEAEYEVDLTDQKQRTTVSGQPAAEAEEAVPEASWIGRSEKFRG